MLTVAYGALAGVLIWIIIRLWDSPVQVLALVLAMHGIDQVLIANFSAIAARPHLINVAVGLLTLTASVVAIIRRPSARPSSELTWLRTLLVGFYLAYACGVFCSGHGLHAGYANLVRSIIPYIFLQLILVPLIIQRSTAQELQRALGATCLLCVCIMLIVAFDTTIQTSGTSAGIRTLLQAEGEKGSMASNSLALGDVGVLAIVTTLLIGCRSEGFSASMGRVFSSTTIGWLSACIAVPCIVWMMRISRTEPLAAAFSLICIWLMRPQKNRLKPLALIGLIGTALCFVGIQLFESVLEYVPQLRLLDQGLETRLHYIKHSLSAYFNSDFIGLLFGLGPGYSYVHSGTYPHNHLVEVMTELGLMGVLLYVVIIWLVICIARRLIFYSPTTLRGIAETTTAMIIFFGLMSLKRGSVLTPGLFMWSILAAEIVHIPPETTCPKTSDSTDRFGSLALRQPLPEAV